MYTAIILINFKINLVSAQLVWSSGVVGFYTVFVKYSAAIDIADFALTVIHTFATILNRGPCSQKFLNLSFHF